VVLKVGVIGAGAMGRRHLQALSGDTRVEIVGVADAVEAAARGAAAPAGARPCRTIADLVAAGAEAVFVTLPNVYHADTVVDALDRGLHVFAEKPMATTLADARRIVARVAAGDRVYQMGFNRRWSPAYRYLRETIDRGFTPYSASAMINDGDMLTPAWYANVAISGGFMFDTAVHLVDMIAWLVGPIERVAAEGRRSCYPDYDDIVMVLRCVGDRPVALATCGHASWAAPQERIELYGDHSLLASEDLDRVRHATRDYPQPAWQRLPSANPLVLWGYVQEDLAFVDACLGRVPPPVTVHDAFHSIAVLDAAYSSIAAGGEPIPVARA
jgi:myo-inositol 2-dehydrogenase / D-chiro-inositol 1-dehydrogenase